MIAPRKVWYKKGGLKVSYKKGGLKVFSYVLIYT